ncbi:MAG: hypothetical protein CMJ45_10355 [Planctomyces sp.]|nr:hypothetical protein [Planctomyces sp.]
MSYTEGVHDSPADTRDRLVRIGSKYQASAPTVADGDNAYLLLDSAGRLLISGAAAHDAAAAGNPLRVGGVYRSTVPAVAAGDIVDLLLDAAGCLQLAFSPDTFKVIDAVAITAGTPVTVWTPASGKTVRLLGWVLSSSAAAALEFQDSAAAGTVIAQTPLLAAAGTHNAPQLGEGIALASADNTLELDVTGSGTISGMVFGIEE